MVGTTIPKRLIVCCDGTWYASDKGADNLPSNVALISRTVAKEGTSKDGKRVPQVVYYQSGVGTGNLGWVDKRWQGAFGSSLNENVCEAYNFLVNNWAAGDEIYLFGFSRGAYTARAIAGLVCGAGLLEARFMDSFHAMYEAFRTRKDGQAFKSTAWAQAHERALSIMFHKGVSVKAIGVFDTVGSLGLPETTVVKWTDWNRAHRFHNTKLDPGIEHAFHALALDERRYTFAPTMWYLPPARTATTTTTLRQCWFPGYHADVGGGTTESKKDEAEIDEIAFAWMVDQVRPLGLAFDGQALFKYYLSKMHLNEWGKGLLTDTMSYAYYLPGAGGAQVRTPGRYRPDDGSAGVTCEVVHPSVWHRVVATKARGAGKAYKPAALDEWEHVPGEAGVGYRWVRKGKDGKVVSEIPEYRIPKLPLEESIGSLDRHLAPKELLKELDESWERGG